MSAATENELDQITVPAGTRVKINGMPFWLATDTLVHGSQANWELAKGWQPKVASLPSVAETSLTGHDHGTGLEDC